MFGSKGYFANISNKPEQTAHNILKNAIDQVILNQFIWGKWYRDFQETKRK